jgi:hypothetical protein
MIIRFIWLQKVLGLCDQSETGRLEKEKEKNEGVDYTPHNSFSVAMRKPWEERKEIKIEYMTRLLTAALCCDRH